MINLPVTGVARPEWVNANFYSHPLKQASILYLCHGCVIQNWKKILRIKQINRGKG